MNVDVAIVGGGPAGLAAAREVAARGGEVAVFDEQSALGGKLRGQLHEEAGGTWWKGWERAAELVEAARSAGAALFTETLVWGVEAGWRLHVADTLNRDRSPRTVEARLVLVATGASERPVALPGWTLPGVMTVGAAQVLTNVFRVTPGERVLVVGIDALSLTVARQLTLAGVEVVAVVLPPAGPLTGPLGSPAEVLRNLGALARSAPTPALRVGATLLRTSLGVQVASRVRFPGGVRVWGIPVDYRTALLEVRGDDRVRSALLAPVDAYGRPDPGGARDVPVDAVCLSGGLTPLAELAAAAGAHLTDVAALGGVVPLHDRSFQTSLDGLFVAGNTTGVEGAEVATAQGRAAGLAMCRRLRLGTLTDEDVASELQKLDDARRRASLEFYPGAAAARAELEKRWRDIAPRP